MRHIADTGFLVALLYRRDQHHAWATSVLKTIRDPLVTCEAVLTEATHLVAKKGLDRSRTSGLLDANVIEIGLSLADEAVAQRVHELLVQYRDRPMDFADACVLVLSEQHPTAEVLTIDSDFRFYRRFGNEAIPTRMPWGVGTASGVWGKKEWGGQRAATGFGLADWTRVRIMPNGAASLVPSAVSFGQETATWS